MKKQVKAKPVKKPASKKTKLMLFNTLGRKLQAFKSAHGKEVRMYVCGPTVNDVPHLGHARQQVTFDVLRKTLEYNGYKVKLVSNITDVDDKIINKARELNEDIAELTKRNTLAHQEDYAKIGVQKPSIQTKATEYIKEMIDLIKRLEKKGYTYVIMDDGVYFNTAKFKGYGKLSGQDLLGKETKSRVKVKEAKKNKQDFVLWKFSKPGEPQWDSPWGSGRPGWHIECSAMSHATLGLPLDIHGGGQDLIFPHHEDEIAQSEAGYGKKFANFWVHNAMVNVDNVKMSKSLGNFRTIRDVLENYSGKVIRYFSLSTHYRKPLDFTFENLDAAKNTYERITRKVAELRKEEHKGGDNSEKYAKDFLEAIDDDLNMPRALQVFHKALDDFDFAPKEKLKLLEKFDFVLGLGISEMKEKIVIASAEIETLLKAREEARQKKMWAEADILRERIKERGYTISDTAEGPKLSKI